MQYYRNGFYPGDPSVAPTAAEGQSPLADGDEVDVLVAGTGPAGLVLSAQLAQFPDIRTRVVERRDGPLQLGQADGVACRTMEMFQAFGFAAALKEEAYWVNQTTFWEPDESDRSRIVRTGRVQDVEDGLSEMPHVIMNQARVHEHLLAAMRRSASRLKPDYDLEVTDLRVDQEGEHPVRVTLRRGADGSELGVRARYVVGCDGGRSNVRRLIDRDLSGDRADHAWGVMDVLVSTDFPDIRFKSAIQSQHGSLVIIPREGGYLVRLYVDLGPVTKENRTAIRAVSADEIVAVANQMLHPYRLEPRETVWCSVYEVAQRIADAFDDAVGRGREPRVFIAGDACHTHSAKAGQGMNVSMQDAFNLGWKLAAVLDGCSPRDLLETYDAERRPVAQELIDFDREWSSMLGTPSDGSAAGVSDYFVQHGRYTAGLATRYPASRLTGAGEFQSLATGFPVGMRFHSAPVVRVADGKQVELGHTATADGRWRLYAFADRTEQRLGELMTWLESAPESPVVRQAERVRGTDAAIDVRGVVQRRAEDVELSQLPPLLHPETGDLGLVDHERAFAAALSQESDIFELRGIDREQGCLVVVRPDQYVADVLPLDGGTELAAYFSRVFT